MEQNERVRVSRDMQGNMQNNGDMMMGHIRDLAGAFSMVLACAAFAGAPSASAAPIGLNALGSTEVGSPMVHKVHKPRGRVHCDSRWSRDRGWHWHKRACQGRDHRYRNAPRYHRGHKRYDRTGCSWHPRYGLKCNF